MTDIQTITVTMTELDASLIMCGRVPTHECMETLRAALEPIRRARLPKTRLETEETNND